jgi:hypothetical protein
MLINDKSDYAIACHINFEKMKEINRIPKPIKKKVSMSMGGSNLHA